MTATRAARSTCATSETCVNVSGSISLSGSQVHVSAAVSESVSRTGNVAMLMRSPPLRLVGVVEPPARDGHERVLERPRAVTCSERGRRALRDETTLVQDPDPVGEPRGLVQV